MFSVYEQSKRGISYNHNTTIPYPRLPKRQSVRMPKSPYELHALLHELCVSQISLYIPFQVPGSPIFRALATISSGPCPNIASSAIDGHNGVTIRSWNGLKSKVFSSRVLPNPNCPGDGLLLPERVSVGPFVRFRGEDDDEEPVRSGRFEVMFCFCETDGTRGRPS